MASRATDLACAVAIVFSTWLGSIARADLQATFWTGRLDPTYAGNGQYRVWASQSLNGVVISRRDAALSDGTSLWTDHGAGSAAVSSKGVAATGYLSGTDVYELVVYVGTDGKLNVGSILNGGSITWYAFDPPTGKTLTGHVATATFTSSGSRYLAVGATTTDGKMFRYVGLVSLAFAGSWTDSSASLSWLTDNPLGVTVSPDETIVSIFGSHTSGSESLGMVRWNGTAWATTNLSRPSGKRVCRSIAAAQGMLTTLSSSKRVVVACTPHNSVGEMYLAVATDFTTTTFTWTTYSSPTSTYYQSVGAVLRNANFQGTTKAIDVYATAALENRIQKGIFSSSGSFAITDLGRTPDQGSVIGGVGVTPAGQTSIAFFVDSQNGRNYLYSRYGGNTSSSPQNYRASGDPGYNGLAITNYFAEGKIATWQGTMAAAVLSRPGTGGISDWPRTYLLYSPDEGEQGYSPVLIPNVVSGKTYNYVSDPTAVVTDQRTIYAVQEGLETSQCSSGSIISEAIYLVTTTPSTYPTLSTPLLLRAQPGDFVDHPYADVQHRAGQADLIHIAWVELGAGIYYVGLPEGSTSPIVHQLSTSGTAPRVTASDSGRVIVYYGNGGQVYFCEVYDTNADGVPDTCCINGSSCGTSAWQTVDPGPAPNYPNMWSTPAGGLGGPGVSGSNIYIRAAYPISMAISESGDTLYYCFDKNETNGDGPDSDTREEADAFCTTGTRDPATGLWSWDTSPLAITGVTNDNKDQFAPEVLLTQEQASYTSGQETAIVTVYDRSDDSANYYYKVKKVVSPDRLVTFYAPKTMFGGAQSDPQYLPRHCFDSDTRFIGDYAGSEGYTVHGQSLSVTVPSPGTIETTVYSNFNALGQWSN